MDERAAAMVNAKNRMPLHVTTPKGALRFWLDGAGYQNSSRSDCCLAWSVGALPKPKPPEEPAASTTGKKRRVVVAAKKAPAAPTPTHDVKYEKLDTSSYPSLKGANKNIIYTYIYIYMYKYILYICIYVYSHINNTQTQPNKQHTQTTIILAKHDKQH